MLGEYQSDPRFEGRFTAHDLRRTFVTQISRVVKGVNEDLIRRVVNHSNQSTGTMRHYNHYDYLDEKRELLQSWADHIDAITK